MEISALFDNRKKKRDHFIWYLSGLSENVARGNICNIPLKADLSVCFRQILNPLVSMSNIIGIFRHFGLDLAGRGISFLFLSYFSTFPLVVDLGPVQVKSLLKGNSCITCWGFIEIRQRERKLALLDSKLFFG